MDFKCIINIINHHEFVRHCVLNNAQNGVMDTLEKPIKFPHVMCPVAAPESDKQKRTKCQSGSQSRQNILMSKGIDFSKM